MILDVSRPTVQLWRERFLALRLSGLEKDAPRTGRFPKVSHKKVTAIVNTTLQTTPPDVTHWSIRSMAPIHPETSSGQNIQTQPRQTLSGETLRHRRSLSEPSRQSNGFLCGRKESDSSPGTFTAIAPPAVRCPCKTNSRLLPSWHNNFICRIEYAGWHRDRRLYAAPPAPGVHQVLTDYQRKNSIRFGPAPDCGQLRNSQTPACSKMDKTPPPFSPAFYTHIQFLAEYGGEMVF